jgi:hypothetical protein
MNVLIVCAGTDGDCFPVFTLALDLRRRGHHVTVMAPPVYSGIPILDDIGFLPLCTMLAYQRFIAEARLLAGRYTLLALKELAVCWNLAAWRAIETLHASDLLVLAPDQPFFWADVAAKLQFGCAAVRFQIEPPRIPMPGVAPAQLPFGRVQEYLAATLALRWHGAATEAGLTADCGHSYHRSLAGLAYWPAWQRAGRSCSRLWIRAPRPDMPASLCNRIGPAAAKGSRRFQTRPSGWVVGQVLRHGDIGLPEARYAGTAFGWNPAVRRTSAGNLLETVRSP